ncbi:hypothetical protein CRUP_010737 [Coryphaenoides rupestris]|nr:hypothetical protein CRUP_010737 [Coryphaenoides rupestris]
MEELSESGDAGLTGEPSKTEACEDTRQSPDGTSEEVQTGVNQQEQEEEKEHSPDIGDQSEDMEEGKQEVSNEKKTDAPDVLVAPRRAAV